jgi:hypothetical protein
LDIRGDGLREPLLQSATVVQTAAYFGDQGLGKVKGEGAPWEATVEHVTEVLFPGKAGVAQGLNRELAPTCFQQLFSI